MARLGQLHTKSMAIGMYGVQGVGGSNPLALTNINKKIRATAREWRSLGYTSMAASAIMPLVRLPPKSAAPLGRLAWPDPLAGGLWFPRLDAETSKEFRGFFTIGWYQKDARDSDIWSRHFLDFKDGRGNSVQGAAAVLGTMLQRIDWTGYRGVSIISAMSSGQVTYDPNKPHARLALSLSQRLGFTHVPGALRKQPHKKLHGLNGSTEREREINGRYRLVGQLPGDLVLICDDMLTRGSTLGEIARAIRQVHPRTQLVGIALGKSERVVWAAGCGKTLNNLHLTTAELQEWDRAR
jgi:hypothetical protein